MTWSNGVSQFLSLKHSLYLKAEDLIGLFISYVGYFNKYKGSIYGLTGTLGTKTHTDFLNEFYGVDFVYIPEFKKNKKVIFPEIITYSREEWMSNIIDIAFKRADIDSRAVLIITKTIKEADEVYAELLRNNYSNEKLIMK